MVDVQMNYEPRKNTLYKYEGLPTYDGYLFRKDDGIWFHSNEHGDHRRIKAFEAQGDLFALMPEEVLLKTDWQKQLPDGWFTSLRERIHQRMKNKRLSVRKFFFPDGVCSQGPWEFRGELEYAYFVVAEEVWRQWQEHGEVDDRWWEALAYAALRQCRAHYRPFFDINPWMSFTLYKQVHTAKTHEDRARIVEMLRPRPKGEKVYVPAFPLMWANRPTEMIAA